MRFATLLALVLLVLMVGYIVIAQRTADVTEPDTGDYIAAEQTDPEGASLRPNSDSVVKTVQFYEGEIPTTAPVRCYSYRLPFIDLGGAQAAGCNQEIEQRYGALISQSLAAMEAYQEPVLETLTFTSFVREGVLTLRVDRLDFDGARSSAYFTCDAESGDAVSVETLFAAAGIPGIPEAVIDQAVLERFAAAYGPAEGADTAYTTALYLTQNALQPLTPNRMHLTEDGRLIVALELYAPSGGVNVVELTLPEEP